MNTRHGNSHIDPLEARMAERRIESLERELRDLRIEFAKNWLELSRRTAERDRAEIRLERACNLLRDVMVWHSDPSSADHNGCDKEPCQFCVMAKEVIDSD